MILPLTPGSSGRLGGWRFAGAGMLVLLAVQLIGLPVRAQEADPFSATVKVDATADTVAIARNKARIDGQRRALAAIAERLSPAAKPPRLDDKAIGDLVASHEVANERMSAVRYIADYTFHFKPGETRRILGIPAGAAELGGGRAGADAGTPERSAKPIVLLPVYRSGEKLLLWDDPNPWRDSWENSPPPTGAAPLVVPLGDAGDLAAIDAEKARTGDAEALAALARRNDGADVVVALAELRGSSERPAGAEVKLRLYRAGRLVDSRNDGFAATAGESAADLLRRAVAAIVADIGSGWDATAAAARQDEHGTLAAVLPITSLDDWLRARERLAAVPAIQKIALVSLSRQEATIEIDYSGTPDILKSDLAQIGLDLVPGGPLWRLARTGTAP